MYKNIYFYFQIIASKVKLIEKKVLSKIYITFFKIFDFIQ